MKKAVQSPLISNIIKFISVLVMLAAGYTAVHWFRADIRTLLIIAVFMLLYVLFPGLYFVSKFGLKGEHISAYLARSFFAGFCFQIFTYFISDLLGTDLLLWAAGPAVCAAAIAEKVKKKERSSLGRCLQTVCRAPASFYVFAALVFLYSMITTQYTYISPRFADYSFMKIDFAYHAGIINALSHGFPPLDPWVSGRTIEYHLFTEMLYSIPVRLTGIHSEDILMSCTPYIITPVFSLSLYSFFREFAGRRENAGLYCLATHFAGMFMIRQFASSYFLFHIYSNINNAGMGLSCFLVILTLLMTPAGKDIIGKARTNTKEMIFFGFLVMLNTGIKGPVSIVLVAAMIGTLILGTCLRSINKGDAAATGMACIGFLLVYVYILGAQHSNETGGNLLNLWEVTDTFFLKEPIMESLPGPVIARRAVLLAAFMAFYLTSFLVPFIIGYARELILVITKKKDFIFSRVVIYAACMVGIAAMLILNFSGHSQVYFGFAALAVVPLISFWFLEDMSDNKSGLMKAIRCLFGLSMAITALTGFLYMYNGILTARDTYLLRNENTSTYRNISTKEYEGMEWLRTNTDEDALIACDRYNSVPIEEYDVSNRGHNTHFAYAVYSNRRQYMEGAGFSLEDKDIPLRLEMVKNNRKLYDPGNSDRGRLAKELGIDYLVVSKRFYPAADLSNEEYEQCFSNEEIDIYRIK